MTRTTMGGVAGAKPPRPPPGSCGENVSAPSGDVNDHHDTNAAAFTGEVERMTTTSMMTRRRSRVK